MFSLYSLFTAMANLTKTPIKLSDDQYIEANCWFDKNIHDMWTAHFECADGYQVSIAAHGSIRTLKSMLKSELIDRVIHCGHKVQ